jgi:hypothetical protein
MERTPDHRYWPFPAGMRCNRPRHLAPNRPHRAKRTARRRCWHPSLHRNNAFRRHSRDHRPVLHLGNTALSGNTAPPPYRRHSSRRCRNTPPRLQGSTPVRMSCRWCRRMQSHPRSASPGTEPVSASGSDGAPPRHRPRPAPVHLRQLQRAPGGLSISTGGSCRRQSSARRNRMCDRPQHPLLPRPPQWARIEHLRIRFVSTN